MISKDELAMTADLCERLTAWKRKWEPVVNVEVPQLVVSLVVIRTEYKDRKHVDTIDSVGEITLDLETYEQYGLNSWKGQKI